MQNIDPFLYGGGFQRTEKILKESPIARSKEQNSGGKDFLTDIRQKVGASEFNISTSQLQQTADQDFIRTHIGTNPQRQKLYEAAEEFEAYFAEKMFKEMKKNAGKSSLIHGGAAEEIFDDMLMTERVRGIAVQTNFGLAEKIYQQLSGI